MNFKKLREAVQERAVVEVFTRLVNAVNQAAELVDPSIERDDNFFPNVSAVIRTLDSLKKRIAILELDKDMWSNMSNAIASRIQGDRSKTWIEVRSLIVRDLIPRVIASFKLIFNKKLSKDDIQVTAAKERVNALQALVTGLAPSTGIPEDDALSDEEPPPENPVPENEPEENK